mmetsp:Transcript_12517/g.32019  ORF Transcript_12517/g.32019 Transcript_12517/m.32019 type:complete len:385 (+) Transcript_12517:1241-2395(+)
MMLAEGEDVKDRAVAVAFDATPQATSALSSTWMRWRKPMASAMSPTWLMRTRLMFSPVRRPPSKPWWLWWDTQGASCEIPPQIHSCQEVFHTAMASSAARCAERTRDRDAERNEGLAGVRVAPRWVRAGSVLDGEERAGVPCTPCVSDEVFTGGRRPILSRADETWMARRVAPSTASRRATGADAIAAATAADDAVALARRAARRSGALSLGREVLLSSRLHATPSTAPSPALGTPAAACRERGVSMARRVGSGAAATTTRARVAAWRRSRLSWRKLCTRSNSASSTARPRPREALSPECTTISTGRDAVDSAVSAAAGPRTAGGASSARGLDVVMSTSAAAKGATAVGTMAAAPPSGVRRNGACAVAMGTTVSNLSAVRRGMA